MSEPHSVESYAHKAAKATLIGWLREKAVHDKYNLAAGLQWRVNREGPSFGIWEEYPVVSSDDIDCCVWDESAWWINLESLRIHGNQRIGHALLHAGQDTLRGFGPSWTGSGITTVFWRWGYRISTTDVPWMGDRQPIPTYAELVELGCAPRVIFDVAIQHKGCIVAAIEIVHRHGISDKKRALLREFRCPTYVVQADWILSQVRCPDRLVVIEALNHNSYFGKNIEFARNSSAYASRGPMPGGPP